MNSKTRVFSFILAICLILNSGMSISVFGANGSGFWLFSSGSRNSDESSIAANREENGASDTDIVDNADEVTEYEEDTDEQDDAPVISDELVGDMLVYKDDAPENGTVAEEVSLVYEDDDIFVTLTGAQEALPEDGTLEVSEVRPTDNNSAEAYANAFTALTEKLLERGENFSDAKLYDFTIYDAYGKPVEPDGPVSVRIEYKSADAFADIPRDSIRVAHIIENKDEEEASADSEDDMTENDAPEVDDEEIVGATAQRREMFVEDTPSDELYFEDAESVDIEEELVGASDEEPAYAEEELVGASDEEPAYAEEELVGESDVEPVDIEEQPADASDEVLSSVTAEIVETTVEQSEGAPEESSPVTLTFVTESFSYYIVFGGSGSVSEPADLGNYGWIRFATSGAQNTAWGFYPSESQFPSYTDVNNRTRRIFAVNLWLPRNASQNSTTYDETDYYHPADASAQYFWVWSANNQMVIDEFEIPGYEVAHSRMHTAWNDANGIDDIEGDGLEGVYSVRGYIHGLYDQLVAAGQTPDVDFKAYDLNTLDVYLKPLPTHGDVDTTHYVIRYVHADGSVSDGNEKELWNQNGYNRAYFDQSSYCRDNETYAGFTLATGNEAVKAMNGTTNLVTLQNEGKGYIEFNSQVDLAKVTIYYKTKPTGAGASSKVHYDRNETGEYYTGAKGLYTDKNVQPTDNTDGRHYLLNLESWYVDQSVSVGMVLDASGSMAWTSGIPEPIILDDKLAEGEITYDQYWDLVNNYTDSEARLGNTTNTSNSMNYINDLNKLHWLLNEQKTDNSMLNYNGYHYYLKDDRASVNEYVALGYWDGKNMPRLNVTSNNGGMVATDFIQLSSKPTYAVENFSDYKEAGWYYVNSTGKTPEFLQYTGKSYEGNPYYQSGKWNRRGAIRFFVERNSDMKYELKCTYFSNSQRQVSKVYEKRYKMFTKNETLQDALTQFGTILLGNSSVNQIAITRFSQDIVETDDTAATDTSRYFRTVDGSSTGYLKLLNWTSSTNDVAAAMNQNPTDSGGTRRGNEYGPGLAGTYGYGLTGQTTTYAGVKAFINEYKRNAEEASKKYIIIFTDGKDLHRNSNASDADDTTNQGLTGRLVRQLKADGFNVVTILMKSQTFYNPDGTMTGDYNTTKSFLTALASPGKLTDNEEDGNYNSPENLLYFEADSNSSYELVQEFRKIANRITSSLNEYSVIDYIDPRFDVTNDAGRILTVLDENGEFTHATNHEVDEETGLESFTTPDGKKAYLGYDSDKKMFYVKWEGQTIPTTTVDSETVTPWKSQIRIQAKDDFLGGNDILTNGNDPTLNKVYYTGNDTNSSTFTPSQYPAKVFPQTSANPAILDENLDYTEDTIYLGEAIDPADKFKWLFETTENDNLYIEYLKRYVKTAEYLGSEEFRNSSEYTSLDNTHKAKIDAFVRTYESLKDDIADFTADGARDIEATDDDSETKEKLTLNIPYYYLEDSSGRENQPGTIWHMLDKIGTISYAWETDEDVPDPYVKRATTENDPDPIVYTLKVSYKPDSMAVHEAGARDLAAEDMDGILPNAGQYFNLRLPTAADPEDTSTHYAGTVYQTVSEGNSPVITKRVYLSELENDPDDSSDISSTLVDKVMHYLQDAENNTNGQKDYPFTVSDGTNTVNVTLRIKKPAEGAEEDVKLAYQWITKSGDEEVVLSGGNITAADLLAAADKGCIDFNYTVTDFVVPDDSNPNTKNTKQYTVTDANAGKAISNLESGSISLVKHINKTQVLNDIENESKQGVLLEFKMKRTYIDPMYEPDPAPTPDPGATPTPNPDATPTPLPGQVDEYYKLRLVLGGEPLPSPTPTPTPTPDPGATEAPTLDPDVTPTPPPTPSPTPIPYDKTVTATISKADLEALQADEDGNIAITPKFELNKFKLDRLPIGTYEIEEVYTGDYTLKSFEDITPDGDKKAYVKVDGNGKSAVIYLNQVVSGVPAEATIDSTRQRLNAQQAVVKVVNTIDKGTHLKLTKKDSVDDSLLENVIFEIFEDAACTTKVSGTLDADGNEADVFTTGEDGTLTIDGLHPEEKTVYYLREKRAAEGHYLLSGAIPVKFNSSGALVLGEIRDPELASHVRLDEETEDDLNDMIVTNSPYFDLPSAGGPGNYIFTIIGVAICTITVLSKYRERSGVSRR